MMPLPFSTGVWLPLLVGQTAAIPGHLTAVLDTSPPAKQCQTLREATRRPRLPAFRSVAVPVQALWGNWEEWAALPRTKLLAVPIKVRVPGVFLEHGACISAPSWPPALGVLLTPFNKRSLPQVITFIHRCSSWTDIPDPITTIKMRYTTILAAFASVAAVCCPTAVSPIDRLQN